MRKRWVWIGVAATALILAVFALLPREPDGLDFIRKYRPKQERLVAYEWTSMPSGPRVYFWHREFDFVEIPKELYKELETDFESNARYKLHPYISWRNANRDVDSENQMLLVSLRSDPPWLIQKWQALTDWFSPPATK
ncbi:MAG: hypothetical protein H7Y17_14950 [Chlorobia bacterium]|nr:hypothetical protein [Fimbriimonadaceae bacterium]